MSRPSLDDSLWLASQARGASSLARLAAIVFPIAGSIIVSIAADGLFVIGLFVVAGLAVGSAVLPESVFGVATIGWLAVEWVVRVDHPTSPWAMGVAASIGGFHLALTFAATTPAGASLDPAWSRRWLRRAVVVIVPSVLVWLAVVVMARVELGRQSMLVAASLLLLAVATYQGTAFSRRRE